ncbi:hypothetical protein ACFLRT_00305 [Acidobacteriota bacterium]
MLLLLDIFIKKYIIQQREKVIREESTNCLVRISEAADNSPSDTGDAVFVEGARPDVEKAYPGYPMNYRAGWGYMMLTNFLPNGGNGTFKIHAIAVDSEGHQVTLGTKTINCDNTNAVKPFGAIDTPDQGGTASGSNFINCVWFAWHFFCSAGICTLPKYVLTKFNAIHTAFPGLHFRWKDIFLAVELNI